MHRQIINMSDTARERLQDILLQHILLEEKKMVRNISQEEKEELCRQIDELLLERDRLIYGDRRGGHHCDGA